MHILWLIIIGFVAGIIAKFLHPGSSNEPSGFILTTLLGIAGSFVATYLGQALGWYQAGEGAGLIGAVVGAIIVLVVWGFFYAPATHQRRLAGQEEWSQLFSTRIKTSLPTKCLSGMRRPVRPAGTVCPSCA